MKSYPHPLIAREGWPFLALSIFAAIAVHYFVGQWTAFPLWLISVFMLQFFRESDPRIKHHLFQAYTEGL